MLESHAVLIRTPLDLPAEKHQWVQRLLMRIGGVQQVRESKYIMLHAPRSALPEIRGTDFSGTAMMTMPGARAACSTVAAVAPMSAATAANDAGPRELAIDTQCPSAAR